MNDETVERNKNNVVNFYDLMFNQNQPANAIERYVGADYRQHNPHVGDGKQAFTDYFVRMALMQGGTAAFLPRSSVAAASF